jgi:hypothetical protein
VDKGFIRKVTADVSCGACRSCVPKRHGSEYYEWHQG